MGDRLGKTKTSKLELAKASLVALLSRADHEKTRDNIAVISVNSSLLGKSIVNEVVPLRPAGEEPFLVERILHLRNEGGTALYPGIEYGLELLSKQGHGASRRIIVVTDSRSDSAGQNDSVILTSATKSRTKIHFIVLGDDKNKKGIEPFRTISELTGGQVVIIDTPADLEKSLSPLEVISPQIAEKSTGSAQVPNAGGTFEKLENAIQPEMVKSKDGSIYLIPVAPKRKKSETFEEISNSITQLTNEYSDMERSLKEQKITNSEFTEKYSIIQYELMELRQSIRELRSSISREMTELALARGESSQPNSSLKESSDRLVELGKKISQLQKTAELV